MVDAGSDPLLICGIGSLGQICLERLRHFDVPLICIDQTMPDWRSHDLREAFSNHLVIGDMRRPDTLLRAQVIRARSVLLLGSDSSINLEAALQVRILNPKTTIVVRSNSQQASLHAMLQDRLPNLMVVDPLLLSAGAIAQSLRPDRAPATFLIGDQRLRLERVAPFPSEWSPQLIRPLQLLSGDPSNEHVQLVVHLDERSASERASGIVPADRTTFGRLRLLALTWRNHLRSRIRQPRGWDFVVVLTAILFFIGIHYFANGNGLQEGLFITVALLKGEFVDPVNLLISQSGSQLNQLPLFTLLSSLLYALIGTVLTSAIVAIILDQVLSRRLGLRHRRWPKPGTRTVLLMQGGDLAVPVSDLLALDGVEVVRADWSSGEWKEQLLNTIKRLRRTHFLGAGLLSSDLLSNLRVALQFQQTFPGSRHAIVSEDLAAADALGDLLGGITLISTLDLAADAFVATAFGEMVEEVRRLDGRNLLLVRYRVDTDDSLHGLSIDRLQCGYGVTAVALRRRNQTPIRLIPPLEWTLAPGQELFVLADLQGLRRIECQQIQPPSWQLRYQVLCRSAQSFDTQQVLARHLGEAPGTFAAAMDGVWHSTPPLDLPLALQLQSELRRMAVKTEWIKIHDSQCVVDHSDQANP